MDNLDKIFLDKVSGFAVASLEYYKNEKFIKEASYHFHFLYSYSSENDMLDILCLDTKEVECISNYSHKNKLEQEICRKNSLENIITIFVKRSLLAADGKINRDDLFTKSIKKYWDVFNDKKDEAYLSGIKQFYKDTECNQSREYDRLVYKNADRTTEIKANLEMEYIFEKIKAA